MAVALVTVLAVAAGPAAGLASANAPVADGEAAQVGQDDETATNETATNESDRFELDADLVERCGLNCRNVTANLTNTGNDTAENVTANVTITADDEEVWERNYTLGNVSANESVERSSEISVGPRDLYAIEQNDGFVFINVTVEWDGGNQTFTERRQVT